MAKVDPRLYNIPVDLQKTPEVRKYFEDLERFLHDLWFRTGGGNDAIIEVEASVDNGALSKSAILGGRIGELEAMTFASQIPWIIKHLEELEMRPDNKARIAMLEKRISDLELQQ